VDYKAIRIDTEAYRRLCCVRKQGESFSQVIKRVLHEPIDFERWMAGVESDRLSEKAAKAVETVVAAPRIHRRRRK